MKRVLVIGGGSIGERHVRCFLQTQRAEVSLCEIADGLRDRLADKYPLSAAYRSFDAAIDDAFDAAIICTPAHLHIPMAQELAERNVNLLIEKPLSTTLDDIDSLQTLIEEKQLVAAVAYVTRVHPAVVEMKHAIDSGRFGRPVELVLTSGQHFPLYRPAYREIYYTRHETGGGAIQDALTHSMNAAEWLVGPVTRLVVDAEHCVLQGVDVEDTVHVITRHGNVMGSFTLNQHQAPNESTLTVICDEGVVRFESHHSRWLSCVEPGTQWLTEAAFQLERDDLFVRQANSFLDLLHGVGNPPCPLADGLQTLRVNLAALQSVREQKWIEL